MADQDNLQFDRAEPAQGQAGLACAVCGRALTDRYFEANGQVVCESCRLTLETEWNRGGSAGRFGKALGLGAAAMIACSVVWYLVLKWTDSQWGILAIVVGFVVGGAVRKGSNGRGGWRYQTLAILLTYTAVVSSYVPFIIESMRQGAATVALVAILFATPFLMGIENLIGLLIIGIALYEAWKLNRKVELKITGPYRVSAGAAPA